MGKEPREVLPEPGEDPARFSEAERRTALLLAAWVQGRFPEGAGPREIRVAAWIATLAEDLEAAPWLSVVPEVDRAVEEVEGGEENPWKIARAILRGRKVRVAPALRLEEVAKRLYALKREKEVEARVHGLLFRSPTAKLTPRSEKEMRVILGRLRAGKKVWVRAGQEEFEALKAKVCRTLSQAQPRFLDPGFRWGDPNKPHPRILVGLARIRAGLREEVLEAWREARREGYRPNPNIYLVREEEEEILLHLLKVVADWTDPVATLQGLEEALVKAARLPRVFHARLSERAMELLRAEETQVLRKDLLRLLKQVRRRILLELEGGKEPPERAGLWDFLESFRPRPQGWVKEAFLRVRGALARGQVPDPEDYEGVVLEAMVGALEVFAFRPALAEEALGLAYEVAEAAVRELRSPHYHPAALAARKARHEVLPRLLERKGGSLGKKELRLVARARRALAQGMAWEELPGYLGVKAEELAAFADLIQGPLGPRDEEVEVASPQDPMEEVLRKEAARLLEEALKEVERRFPGSLALAEALMEGKSLEGAARELGLPLEEAEVVWELARWHLMKDPRVQRAKEVVL